MNKKYLILIGIFVVILAIIFGIIRQNDAFPFLNQSKSKNTLESSPTNRMDENIRIVKSIVEEYHQKHTYFGTDIFVCGDMASDVWDMVETQGINSMLQVGNVEKEVSEIQDANHVWVLAEVAPGRWIALETTGGYLVCSDSTVCAVNNPLYYRGWSFNNTKEFKDALDRLKHPCEDGFVLGSDNLCHQACGGNRYCTGNSICINGECRGCDYGYVIGQDYQCHQECPIGSGRYCLSGLCGTDGLCHAG